MKYGAVGGCWNAINILITFIHQNAQRSLSVCALTPNMEKLLYGLKGKYPRADDMQRSKKTSLNTHTHIPICNEIPLTPSHPSYSLILMSVSVICFCIIYTCMFYEFLVHHKLSKDFFSSSIIQPKHKWMRENFLKTHTWKLHYVLAYDDDEYF
jgi:hypothetical protein